MAGNFVNLSRVDPTILCMKSVQGGSSPSIFFRGNNVPAVCLSVVNLQDAFLEEPHLIVNLGKYQKMITGIFHTLEYERWVSCVCVIAGTNFIRSQLDGRLMTFATRAGNIGSLFSFFLHFLISVLKY